MDNSLIVIFLQIGIVLASGYLISYIKKKANNYADKNDLKELTSIVEKEKTKYATDLSIIKTQLDIVANNKKNYREIEVEVISEFYSVCNWLVYDFWNLDFAWFNSNHHDKIEEISNEVFSNLKKLTVAKGRFNLFIYNKDLVEKGYELHYACIEYSAKIQSFARRLKTSLKKQIDFRNESYEFFKSKERDTTKENQIIKDEKLINEEVSAYSEEYKILRKDYNDAVVIKTIVQFENSARIYLSNI